MKTILKNLQKTIDKQNKKCYNNYRKKEKIINEIDNNFLKKIKKTLDKIIKKGYNNNVRKSKSQSAKIKKIKKVLDKPYKKCYNKYVNKNKSLRKKEVLIMAKMTKKDYFNTIATIVANSEVENKEDIQAFISHELELLAKKSGKSGQTKTQKENEVIIEKIYDALAEVGSPVTITELQSQSPAMAEYSNQKLSALIKKLVDNGRVTKTIDKKKSYFSIKEVEVDETENE